MDLVDSKFIGLVSSRLEKFKRIKPNLYNCRCPICGDSQKHRNKARGYFYAIKANTNYKCHNCGASLSFNNFLKQIDPILHKRYIMEKFKDGHTSGSGKGNSFVVEEPKFNFDKPVFDTVKINLPLASKNDRASNYLKKRKLNPTKFFYAEKFKEFCNSLKRKSFTNITKDHARIVIPFYDADNRLIGFQGRSLDAWIQPKYLTIMINEEAPKIYGLDRIDKDKTIYVVEGPFDSTFIENSIALCGSDGDVEYFKESNYVYAYDNEPRNKEIVSRIERCINNNKRVVIWPKSIREKDINDMVLAGHNVQDIVESNNYSGLEAKLNFTNWRK